MEPVEIIECAACDVEMAFRQNKTVKFITRKWKKSVIDTQNIRKHTMFALKCSAFTV